MSMSTTEKVGFARQVLEYIEKNGEALKTAGFDAAARLKDQTDKLDAAVTANEAQDSLKTTLKKQTEKANELLRELYVTASGNLDAMMGLLRKNSPDAVGLRRLRSKVRFGAHAVKDIPKAA